MFFGMRVGNNHFFTVVREDAAFGDRAAPNVPPDILQSPSGILIGWVNVYIPFLSTQLVEQIVALLNRSARRRHENLIFGFCFAACVERI